MDIQRHQSDATLDASNDTFKSTENRQVRPLRRDVIPLLTECLGVDLDPFLNSLLNPKHLRAMPSTREAVDINLTTGLPLMAQTWVVGKVY